MALEAHNSQNSNQRNGQRNTRRDGDEILEYLDARYIGPCEAAWRLLGFEMHARHPAIARLQVLSSNC